MKPYDYVIVGAGFSGAVLAERITSVLGKKVLLIEKRSHIGGNAYDEHNAQGHLIHRYGPHIFHTSAEHVWQYLSQFTEWFLYRHRVLGLVDNQLVPIPFNFNSIEKLFPRSTADRLIDLLLQGYGYNAKVPILKLSKTENPDLQFLAEFVYQKVFLNYTMKQWGMSPESLDPGVTARVPVYLSRDDHYFQNPYQGIPLLGYTALFKKLLASPKIHIMLNTDAAEIVDFNPENGAIKLFGKAYRGTLIYSGKIDALFNYQYGELPYRTLEFQFESKTQDRYQEVGTVNYPNHYQFTRITEFKHLSGQTLPGTTVVKEFPHAYDRHTPGRDIPYYPIPYPESKPIYQLYLERAREVPQLILIGRLAEYRYYDMDAIVARALKLFRERIQGS